jgi:hypothetical protein
MRVALFFLGVVAFSLFFRSCNKPVYDEGCRIICGVKGFQKGQLIDNFTCLCDGFRTKKERPIRLP